MLVAPQYVRRNVGSMYSHSHCNVLVSMADPMDTLYVEYI